MLRTMIAFTKVFLYLISIEPKYWKIKRLEREGRIAEKDAILMKITKDIASSVLSTLKIQVEVEGKEHIPSDGTPYILTPNHSSILDFPVLFQALDQVTGFVSKIENRKIPFIGRWISLIYSVYIDRSSPRSAVKSFNVGVEMIKSGHPQVIFPEGTRSRDGKLLEFKAGSYKLAKKAEAKVIPVAIVGIHRLSKGGKNGFKPGTVKVIFFEALDSTLDTIEMAEISQKRIAERVQES